MLASFRTVISIASVVLFLFAAQIFGQEKMTMFKVAEGVYFMENSRGSGNSTFVVTEDGVLVFDFHIANADQTLAAIRKVTDKKVRYLISSHSAGDHASGAWHFREDKPVYIATKNQVKDMFMQEGREFEERRNSNDPNNAPYKGKELVRPDIGFDGGMTLYFGGLTFQITAEGTGHSTGDLTVYIPQRRVMLMGDLLDTEIHPGQGESAGVFYSYVKGWVEILDGIMQRNLAVDTYVPGHGPVHVGRGVKDLEEQKRYFVVMRDEVAKMIQAGKTAEQIQKEFKVPQEFAHYRRPERLRQFLRLFYNQLIDRGL
jgi:glyoxylase-like metal-dependent hydrolase (beta-lactamase superfamily II)